MRVESKMPKERKSRFWRIMFVVMILLLGGAAIAPYLPVNTSSGVVDGYGGGYTVRTLSPTTTRYTIPFNPLTKSCS